MRMTTRIVALAAAALLSVAGTSQGAGNILFEANAVPLSVADQAIVDRLTNVLGYTVTAKDAHTSTPADMAGNHLLIISGTVGSSVMKNQWNSTGPVASAGDGALMRNLALPVLNFQNGLSDEIGFVLNANGGQGDVPLAGSNYPAGGNDVNVLAPAHPLAAGFPAGSLPILTTAGGNLTSMGSSNFFTLGYRFTPDADLVVGFTSTASAFGLPTDASNVGVVAIEQGETLGNTAADADYASLAANRRVGFLADATNFTNLNANGLALFDAAVNYSFAAVPEPSTLVLAGLGLMGLVAYRRRVRR